MQALKKPDWLRIKPPTDKFQTVKQVIQDYSLHTVCQSAHCPNISECWSSGTATFMIMGDICTRGCRFCAVKTGKPPNLDKNEPKNLAKAIKKIESFDYIVLTSVDRDDLEDQGSLHVAECIKEIKKQYPGIKVEVLIPDFQGNIELLKNVVKAEPDVLGHNLETVERLQDIRDRRANYSQSLSVLKNIKKLNPKIYTKSSLMLGLGETEKEVIQTMKDLRKNNVDILTLGQYLKPKNKKLEVKEYIKPEKFKYYEDVAIKLGFISCASAPFVRSSYKAGEVFKILS